MYICIYMYIYIRGVDNYNIYKCVCSRVYICNIRHVKAQIRKRYVTCKAICDMCDECWGDDQWGGPRQRRSHHEGGVCPHAYRAKKEIARPFFFQNRRTDHNVILKVLKVFFNIITLSLSFTISIRNHLLIFRCIIER